MMKTDIPQNEVSVMAADVLTPCPTRKALNNHGITCNYAGKGKWDIVFHETGGCFTTHGEFSKQIFVRL